MRWPLGLALLLAGVAAAGCGATMREVAERVGRGPRAEELYLARSFAGSGRQPTFDEKRMWEDRLDDRVRRYQREHPELEQTPRYTDVRFWRQVGHGATRDEVRALLEEPDEQTIDPALMGALAEQHWTAIGPKAREAWVYPLGWVIYFDDAGAVDFIRRTWGPLDTLD
jgi:hypothetical protein